MKPRDVQSYWQMADDLLTDAGVALTDDEREAIECADLGLGRFETLALLDYINTDRYCAKELILWPRQICPQHRHPPITRPDGTTDPGHAPGREPRALHRLPRNRPVAGSATYHPSYTLHWFQASDEPAIVSEFSSTSRDEADVFTDPNGPTCMTSRPIGRSVIPLAVAGYPESALWISQRFDALGLRALPATSRANAAGRVQENTWWD